MYHNNQKLRLIDLLFSVQASTSTSEGMLTLDLIQEEDPPPPQGDDGTGGFRLDVETSWTHLTRDCPRSRTDSSLFARTTEASGKTQSLPREVAVVWEQTGPVQTPQPGKRLTVVEWNRCASMDEILKQSETRTAKNRTALISHSPPSTAAPINQLQELISQKLEKTERLLKEVQSDDGAGKVKGKESAEGTRGEAERLLKEAAAAWGQAREVLEEVRELRALYRQLESSSPLPPSDSNEQSPAHKILM